MVVRFLTVTIAAWVAVLPILLLQPSTGSQALPLNGKTGNEPAESYLTQIFALRR